MTKRTYVLAVYRDAAGEWRWTLWAPNKRIVADSGEGYSRKAGAVRAAKRLHALMIPGRVKLVIHE